MLRKLKAIGCLVSAAALLVASLFFAYAGISETRIGVQAQNWITASTTITYTYSVRTVDHKGSGIGVISGTEYNLSPSYSFIATDGKTYSGNAYSTFGDRIDRSYNDEVLKSHLLESGDIYYNPKDPRQSFVLKPRFNIFALFIFTFCFALGLTLAKWLTQCGLKYLKQHKNRHA